jgi:hypothetical protein
MTLVFGQDTVCPKCDGTGIGKHLGGPCIHCDSGIIRKAQGQKQVLDNTHEAWQEACRRWVYSQPLGHEYVTDDMIDAVGRPPGHHNAIGAMMTSMAKAGLHVKTGRMAQGRNPRRNSGESHVWRRV